MDVYTLDNAYLGTVQGVIPGPSTPPAVEPHAGRPAAVEDGGWSELDGERLGPVPTQPLGNSGPLRQSARARYATAPDGAPPIGRGLLQVGGRWGLAGRRTIPLELVQTVSLERVVLRLTKAAISSLSSAQTSPVGRRPTGARP